LWVIFALLHPDSQQCPKFVTLSPNLLQVVIFSKTTCPFCDKVKELFRSLNMPYEALELDTMEGGPAIQDLLAGKFLLYIESVVIDIF
jgi:hypothetical protein